MRELGEDSGDGHTGVELGVPVPELGHGDSVLCRNVLTCVAGCDLMPLVAV